MTPADIEEQLRQLAYGATSDSPLLPPDVLDAVRRRRRSRSLAVLSAAAVVTVAGTLLGVAAVDRDATGRTNFAYDGDTPTASPTGITATPAATFAALPPAPRPGGGEPDTFFALIGAGGERLAVVDTATGTVRRYLQGPDEGSQALMTFTPDLSTAYQWDQKTLCNYTWTRIDLRTGDTAPAFDGLGNVNEVAFSPVGARIAYVIGGERENGGCSPERRLVVNDKQAGVEREWSLAATDDESHYFAFDNTASALAFVDNGRLKLLDLNQGTSLRDARVLAHAAGAGCRLTRPVFPPDRPHTVLTGEQCPDGVAVVGYDERSGDEVSREQVGGAGSFLSWFDVDPTGRHLIYSIDGSSYVLEPTGPRHLVDGAYQLAW